MAIPATCVWEIRPTNGTANAGGGFDPSVASAGTDYSYQNAVQIAFTDLVIGGTTTQLTSAANPFGAAHVGNNIAITGGTGFTTGIYNIRSVSGVTATMDRAVGTGGSTGGTGNLGGARSGYSNGTTTLQSSLVAGNKVFVKNEAWNEAVTLSVAGSQDSPIQHFGYNTSRTQGTSPVSDLTISTVTTSNMPTNNRASAAGDAFSLTGADNWLHYIAATAAGDAGFSNTAQVACFGCKSYSNTGEGFENTGTSWRFVSSEAYSNGVTGWGSGIAGSLHSCYSHDNTGGGFVSNGSNFNLFFCISENNSSHGAVQPGSTAFIINCTFDGSSGANTEGLSIDNSRGVLGNCIMSNNARDGVRANSGNGWYAFNNNYYLNGGTTRTNFPTGIGDIALDPGYTNRSGGDFNVGTNMKAAGYPGVFPSSTANVCTGALDIGAVQRTEAGGGSAVGYRTHLRKAA